MTFCIGIQVDEGVVALADTRIARGPQVSKKFKMSELVVGDRSAVVMTSGLRSVRDKTVARLEDALADDDFRPLRMHELATGFGDQLRQVRAEDGESLAKSNLAFNLHAILAGRLAGDRRPVVIEVYPEGNWVAVTEETPYAIIGRTNYGRPILDRMLRHDTPLRHALSLAYLAFDATRASVSDVDFPIDAAVADRDDPRVRRARIGADALTPASDWWQARLGDAVRTLPVEWAAGLLRESDPVQVSHRE